MREAFRAFSNPDIYRDRRLIDAVNDRLTAIEKKNPMVDMPGEIALAMRVMGLFLGSPSLPVRTSTSASLSSSTRTSRKRSLLRQPVPDSIRRHLPRAVARNLVPL